MRPWIPNVALPHYLVATEPCCHHVVRLKRCLYCLGLLTYYIHKKQNMYFRHTAHTQNICYHSKREERNPSEEITGPQSSRCRIVKPMSDVRCLLGDSSFADDAQRTSLVLAPLPVCSSPQQVSHDYGVSNTTQTSSSDLHAVTALHVGTPRPHTGLAPVPFNHKVRFHNSPPES